MTPGTIAAPMPLPLMLPLKEIAVGSNTRKTFVEAEIDELAASLKTHGMLQAMLVRPHPKAKGYELVFGGKRYRAAKKAELDVVPVTIRDLTDEQVLEIQIVENSQRSDVHPLEEAEGYELLHTKYKHDVDTIAAKVNKSRGYVYGRMKLLALCPEARKAYYDGLLTASTALYVARIPDAKLQKEALEELTKEGYDGTVPSARTAQKIIHERFMLKLAEAPFDRTDATLVPKAGACSTCPKRTGNQSELFADVKSGDVCTDPTCFATKRKAHGDRLIADAKAAGKAVIDGKRAAQAFEKGPHARDELSYNASVVDLDKEVWVGSKHVKLRSLAKESKEFETKLIQSPMGTVREVLDKGAADALVAKANKVRVGTRDVAHAVKARAEAAAHKAKRLTVQIAVAEIVDKATAGLGASNGKGNEESFWAMLASIAIDQAGSDCSKNVIARRGIEIARKAGSYGQERLVLKKLLDDTKGAGAYRALALEVLVFGGYFQHETPHPVKLAAAHFKVDLGKAAIAAKAFLSAKKQPGKATKKKGKAK